MIAFPFALILPLVTASPPFGHIESASLDVDVIVNQTM
jgi:hypothetical protein